MIVKKLLILTIIITGFSFVADSGNCTDNSDKKHIFKVVYDNDRNENNNNVNNVRGSTFMITHCSREPMFIVTRYDDNYSYGDDCSYS